MKNLNCGTLNIKHVGQKVVLKGWLKKTRKLGEIIFGDIRDRWGYTQFIVSKDSSSYERALRATRESVIQIEGTVIERKSHNPNIPTGEIEINVDEIFIISKSDRTPLIIEDKTDALEEVRLTNRYLDLRRPVMQTMLKKRHSLIKGFRDFLDTQDFIEVETPILTKPTPEGANDFLVPSGTQEGKMFALPQSPQMYKQLLMIAGCEKYFQVARCFRNEALRSDRQLEFTQLDMEMSFTNEEEIQSLMEKMMIKTFKKELGVNIPKNFPKITFYDAMNEYGSDKPDIRYGMKIQDAKKYFVNSEFELFKNADNVKMLFTPKVLSRKQVDALAEESKKFGLKGLPWASYDGETVRGSVSKKILDELHVITKEMDWKEGTILFGLGEWESAVKGLGAIRPILAAELGLIKNNEFKFCWVTDWPLFEYSEEENRFMAAHHPFTQPQLKNHNDFHLDKKNAMARAYDLVLNGYEIGGGSMRIHDSLMQERMFSALGMTESEIKTKFGFFVDAFKYGAPPHGGVALGIDRIIMIMLGAKSLRDVIAFPVNSAGIDMMMNSPSNIE